MEPQTPGNAPVPPTPPVTPPQPPTPTQAPDSMPPATAPTEPVPQPALSAPGSIFNSAPVSGAAPVAPSVPVTPSPMITPEASGKYKVFQAVKDVFSTIKKNPGGTLIPLALGYVGTIVLLVLAFAISGLALAFSTGITVWVIVAVVVLASGVMQVAIQTAFNNAFMIALKETHQNEAKRSVGAYFKQGLNMFGRVFVRSLLYTVYVVGPMLLPFILFFLGAAIEPIRVAAYIAGFLGAIATLIWGLANALSYALYWQVAIFEPETTVKQSLMRSRELMKTSGRWFLVRAVLLLWLVAVIISVATGGNVNLTNSSAEPNLATTIISIILVPFIYGVPTLLYLHLSGNKKQPEIAPAQAQPQAPVPTQSL